MTFVAAAIATFLVLVGALVALDPYDTGRAALVDKPGVHKTGPRIANASRGRDQAFDAAIFGNSRIQLVEPARLDAATGMRFVSLIVPGTYPKEQFVLLDWFLRYHPVPKGLVFGVDEWWCLPRITYEKPFPFWLYERNLSDYIAGLVRFDAIEQLTNRLSYLLGKEERSRPDGFWDYEADYFRIGFGDMRLVREKLAGQGPGVSKNPENIFPVAAQLARVLAGLPATTRVVLAWPPRHHSARPLPGSAAAATEQACHAAFSAVARRRPGTAMVDFSGDTDANRQDENFFDKTHYRRVLAVPFTDAIAAALKAEAVPVR